MEKINCAVTTMGSGVHNLKAGFSYIEIPKLVPFLSPSFGLEEVEWSRRRFK